VSYREVMQELQKMGTAQNRKIYGRHGVRGAAFGVSYANLGKLQKKIKTDHELAEKLWASGNHDARVLSTMVADPARITSAALDAWARDLDNYVLTDAFTAFTARTKHAPAKMKKWTRSRSECLGQTGWSLMSYLSRTEHVTAADCESRLAEIESRIHGSKNRVRHSMNGALIAIGLRSAALEKKAIAAAKRIGRVDVDHGETSCKTPDAVAYIQKTKAHRTRKK
jgi:3-methyladenine DNA glycosylase AlkD